MPSDAVHTIFLVSDGTCRTCELMVRAVLVQFDDPKVRLVKKKSVRRADMARRVVRDAAREHAAVFYTLVAEDARKAIQEAAHQHLVPVVDLLGPVLASLYDVFNSAPRARPGMLYKSNREYFDRIDAVEYTLAHDDGRRLHDLKNADVVLVGVSRTSKSTSCFYLAYSGIRAANVPLFADADPPKELIAVDQRRVIGLTANTHRLQSVREARLHGWETGLNTEYVARTEIARELRAATQQMTDHGWRTIDVSYKAIEEVTREIRQILTDTGVWPRRER